MKLKETKAYEVEMTFKTTVLFSPHFEREREPTKGDAIEAVKDMLSPFWFTQALDEGFIVEYKATEAN